jgi:Phosphoribosyl-AMP cyclohydrolase
MNEELINTIKFDDKGLVPVVVQEYNTGMVLMLAYMNKEAVLRTINTKLATYWSRSRQSYWVKGETSGHFQHVKEFFIDCDKDTLLLKVEQEGPACHTGETSCFYRNIL